MKVSWKVYDAITMIGVIGLGLLAILSTIQVATKLFPFKGIDGMYVIYAFVIWAVVFMGIAVTIEPKDK